MKSHGSPLLRGNTGRGNVMPYSSKTDLPDGVKDNLPSHAREIYRKAFNNAWDEYADPDKRRGDASREETAHRVAWSAVEKVYHKNSQGQWMKD